MDLVRKERFSRLERPSLLTAAAGVFHAGCFFVYDTPDRPRPARQEALPHPFL
jgi:hypothetical protein